MLARITVNPGVHFGKPCIAGTRITVQSDLELIDAWRESLGELEPVAWASCPCSPRHGQDARATKVAVCGPVRVRIGRFRPVLAEVLFRDMEPDDDGGYEPLVGHIALEQAGAAVDVLGHRLVHVKQEGEQ